MDKQKIERPVRVTESSTLFAIRDANHRKIINYDACLSKEEITEIADALNQTGKGSWAWASCEMGKDTDVIFILNGWEYKCSKEGYFMQRPVGATMWRDVQLHTCMTTATDWRRV
jgi:hypothetical protein